MQPNPSVPQTENQAYEVPGRQLGWRVNQLQSQGLPYNVQPAGGGIYIVIVQQPTGMDPFAAPAQPAAPSHRPRFDLSRYDLGIIARWVLLTAVVAGAIWFAGGLLRGAAEPPPAETGNVWDWFDNLRLPWDGESLPDGEPVVLPADDAGWRWPWDAAADAAADTADAAESVQGTVTVAAGAVLAVLVLLILLSLAGRGKGRAK